MVTRFESSSKKRDSTYAVWWRARRDYGEALIYKVRELQDPKAISLLMELATKDKRHALKRLIELIVQEAANTAKSESN